MSARPIEYARRVALSNARAAFDWSSLLPSPLDYDPGQKRDEKGRWTDGFMSDAALESVADLVSIVDEIKTSDIQPQRLYGGQSAETVMFELPDGRKIVRKRAPAWGDPDEPKRAADAEQLGALAAGALGARVARAVREDDETIWVEFVPGEVHGSGDYANEALPKTPELVRLGLFDVLSGNWDRNGGNLIQSNGEFVGIDQGTAWSRLGFVGEPPSTPLGGVEGNTGPDRTGQWFAQQNQIGRVRGFPYWIDNPLTPDDVTETRARLEALRPDYKRLGREEWLDHSLRVLNSIAPYAKGTESIYA